MAKNGQKIDSLYLSIGLDVDQLQLDFDTAGKTVSQTMARLNSEIKQLKIKTSIDTSKLEGVGTDVDKIRVKEQALTRELQLQTQKMNILAAAYKSAQAQYGNDSGVTRKAETSLLGQQAAVEKLKASLRGLAAEEAKIGAGSTGLGRIRDGAQSARAGLDKLSGSYGVLSGKMMAMMAIATTGAGLFTITDSAMMAGEKIYKMSQRLHTSATEAARLNKTLEMAGTDYQQVIPVITRLDKSVESAGSSGNDLTMAMEQFGVSLTDSTGNLLPMNEQLKQLADGYHNAAASGNEEAYVADVLGARGAQLVPLLEQYNDLMEASSHVKTTGLINPEEAHKLYLEWIQLKIEAGQLETAFGAAMMPVAKDIMPEISDGFENLIKYIHDNKDDIRAGIESWGSALKGVTEAAGGLLGTVTQIGSWIHGWETTKALRNDEDVLKAARPEKKWDTGRSLAKGLGALAGGAGGFVLGGPLGAAAGAFAGQEISGDIFTEMGKATTPFKTWAGAKERVELQKQEKESLKAFQEQQKKNTDADKDNAEAAKKNAAAQYIAAAKLKERREATKALTEEIYNLTHSDLDNSLHAMQKTVDEARKKGVDEGTLSEYSAAKSAKIYQQYAENVTQPMAQAFRTDLANELAGIDEQAQRYVQQGASSGAAERWANARKSKVTADWDRQVSEQINSVWRSEYQNQMVRIENEKKAWIDKGLSEVQAARWAAEEKRQIQQKSAQEMMTSNYKLLQLFRSVRMGGGSIQQAAEEMAAQMRKDKGIPDGAFTTPREISEFNEAMKIAQNELVPILSDSVYEGVKRAMIEVQHGTNTAYEDPYGRYRIDLGNAGQDFGGRVASTGSAFHDSVSSAGSVLRDSVYSSSQAFYANVSKSAGNMSAAAKNIVDSSRLWTEKEAEAAHRYNNSLNDSPSLSTMAGKISRDPKIYGGMDPQRAIFNANIDPWNTKHIGQETMNAISEAMQMARGKVVPDNYEEVMPRSIRPEPRQNGRDRRYDDPDYAPRQGQGGSLTVNVNIDRPYVNNDKAITQMADHVSKKILDATQQGQYKY
jgi:hypothetical protein